MSLRKFKMPTLADKIQDEDEALRLQDSLDKKDTDTKKEVKRSSIKKKTKTRK